MYPILIELGPVTIHALWFFISLGFIMASFSFGKLAKRNRLKLDLILANGLKFLFFTVAMSRLVFIIFHFTYFSTATKSITTLIISFFEIWDKGLSFWGGVIGFLIALYFVTKKENEPIKKWLDITAESILLGMLFGMTGAFLDGIAHGSETALPWGVTFQSAVVKYAVPIHPTQLYAFIYIFCIFIAIKMLKHKKKLGRPDEDGDIFEFTVFSMSFFKFLEEFFRGDDTFMLFDTIRFPQIVALGIFIVSITQILKRADFLKNFHLIVPVKKP